MWVGMSGICGSGCLIVGIIRLLGIRIEYLIVGMIGICGSGYSIVGIIVLGGFMSVWTIANSTKTVMKL